MTWDREKERKAGRAYTIGSCIFGILFAVIWCIVTASMGAWFMLLFGIPFVGMMIYRLYVCVQITGEDKPSAKEPEPWERPVDPEPSADGKFCPYCGYTLQAGFEFCPKCGRRLP